MILPETGLDQGRGFANPRQVDRGSENIRERNPLLSYAVGISQPDQEYFPWIRQDFLGGRRGSKAVSEVESLHQAIFYGVSPLCEGDITIMKPSAGEKRHPRTKPAAHPRITPTNHPAVTVRTWFLAAMAFPLSSRCSCSNSISACSRCYCMVRMVDRG